MNKEDKRRYDRMINDIADRLMIDANREAFKITENVFRDIMTALHDKIEQYFNEHRPKP
jgi:UDP-N-acetyl-D-mannosaminuronate dehydrogenase